VLYAILERTKIHARYFAKIPNKLKSELVSSKILIATRQQTTKDQLTKGSDVYVQPLSFISFFFNRE